MTRIIVTLFLAGMAIALPQGQPSVVPPTDPKPNQPTGKGPTAVSPLAIGELPKDGLKSLPWGKEGFEQLAAQLGFDPAKATKDPVSGMNCQTSANGKFCFGTFGSSFGLSHQGGAFNGETWNPITGEATAGASGGLLVGGVGSPDDIATGYDRFVEKVRLSELTAEKQKTVLEQMHKFVSQLDRETFPKETGVETQALYWPSQGQA